MLRTLCVAAIVIAMSLPLVEVREAEARVVMRPSVTSSCPGASTWQATQECLERFGTAKIIRTQGDARLVQLRSREGLFGTSGLYLYVKEKKSWRVGGMYLDVRPSVIGFSTPTFDHRKLFRIDIVYSSNDDIVVDEVTSRNAFVRRKSSLFCSGESPSCTMIMTACDVFVSGRLYSTFRGTLAYQGGGRMLVTGDRISAGDQCSQPEEAFVPVPSIELE
jgi:hypothetical protein